MYKIVMPVVLQCNPIKRTQGNRLIKCELKMLKQREGERERGPAESLHLGNPVGSSKMIGATATYQHVININQHCPSIFGVQHDMHRQKSHQLIAKNGMISLLTS
jgi:hypothetical protein